MTVHSDNFLVNKTNRCTEFQIYLVSQLYMFQAAYFALTEHLMYEIKKVPGIVELGE
jgi:hypothetical protein